jgi:predicted phage tail component-like protein
MIGFTYNNIKSSIYGIVAKSVNRPLLPVLRKRELVVPGKHGSYDFSDNTFENRIIEVELKYVGTSFAELRTRARTIAYWLSGYSGTKNLVFSDEPDKWYVGKIYSEIGLANLFKLGECKVLFECEPFAYADYDEYDETYYYDSSLQYDSGLYYPNESGFTWNLPYQLSGIYNFGTIKTDFKITISGSVTYPKIINSDTEQEMLLSTALSSQTLVIDTEHFTVTIDDVNSLNYFSGDFIELGIGNNSLVFRGDNPSASVTYTWKHRFL